MDQKEAPVPLVLGMGWFPDQPGGLNRYARGLVEAVRRKGVRAYAVVVGPAEDLPPWVTEGGRRDDPALLRLGRYARAARHTRQDATVVDAHFALYAVIPTVIGSLRRLPLVVHFQGPWADESAHSGERRLWRLAAKRCVEQAVYRRARELVVLSGAFRQILVERYGVRPWRIHVVPPGVDVEHFSPAPRASAREELNIPAQAWVALTVRRLVPRMGLDVMLDAWSQVAAQTDGAMLLVSGDGPAREELEARAAALGVSSTVRFLGGVSESQLLSCYRAADVCVVPSVAFEGFGLVVLEALACGTPVVATNSGGLPEALSGLGSDLVVPPGDASALASRLLGAIEGRKPLPDAARCRRHAEELSWEVVAARNLDIYRSAEKPTNDARLRVVYLDHFGGLSGGELALARLLPALHDVQPHVMLAEDGPLVGRLLASGISVEVFPMAAGARTLRRDRVRFGGASPRVVLSSALYVGRLTRRLRYLRPDLVHTNSLKAALYGGVAGRLAGVPVVWHIRDRIAPDYLPAPAVRWVRAAARQLPRAVIANSRSTLATLPGVSRGVVVPSPVPNGSATAAGSPSAEAAFCVGMVGRIAPWKGQHIFLRAFAQAFPPGMPPASWGAARAIIVGAPLFGEEVYALEIKELARELGIEEYAEFAGFSNDVSEQLSTFHALVHASVIPEPFGLVVVEGMAAGLPVIVPAVGGPAEVVQDGITGVLYPVGDVPALADALRTLAADPGLRRQLGQAARARAMEFTPEALAPRVMALYRDVLGSGAAR